MQNFTKHHNYIYAFSRAHIDWNFPNFSIILEHKHAIQANKAKTVLGAATYVSQKTLVHNSLTWLELQETKKLSFNQWWQ